MLGGHASVLFTAISPIVEQISTGKLRVLAVTSRERSELLKAIPTMMESGVPDFDISATLSVTAPGATPKAAVDRLSAEILRAVQLPEVKAKLTLYGFERAPFAADAAAARTRATIEKVKQIASEAKIKLD